MRYFGVIWAILGVSSLLLNAIIRLAPRGMEALQMELSAVHWFLLIGYTFFMLYAEGYKGFQKKFSPRTASRILYLKKNPTILRAIFAPFFAMGFFHANKKTKVVAWVLPVMITCLVLLVSLLPQPWRGIIDVGVVLGLSWGLASFWVFCVMILSQNDTKYSPEMPVAIK